jgi:hypothetical protein
MNRPPSNPYNVSKSDAKRIRRQNQSKYYQELEARIERIEESVKWLEDQFGKENQTAYFVDAEACKKIKKSLDN